MKKTFLNLYNLMSLQEATEKKAWYMFPYFVVSALSHICLFVIVFIFFGHQPYTNMNVVNVDLISIPGGNGKKIEDKSPKVLSPDKVAEKKVEKETKKEIAKEVKKEILKETLVKKTVDKNKTIKSLANNSKKENIESDLAKVTSAIDKIKKNIGENIETNSNKYRGKADSNKTDSSGGTGMSYGFGREGKEISNDIVALYQAELAQKIQQNWSCAATRGKPDLKTTLEIEIMKNGEIKDIQFDQRSGNSHLDDCAYKAVMKSNPFTALPDVFGSSYKIGLYFTQSGIE